MQKITKYMLWQLIVGVVVVSGVLSGVTWLASSLRFIELIVNRGVSTGMFLMLTMLRIPEFLTVVLPIATFAAVVFVYSKMNSDREIVILRAVGQSPLALGRPALIMAIGVTLFAYGLTFYLMPKSYQRFRNIQWDLRHSYGHVLLQEGMFNAVTGKITVFVRARSNDGELNGILIQDDRDPVKRRTIIAERGALVESGHGVRVVAFNGNQQLYDTKTKKLSILYFDRHSFDLGSQAPPPSARFREPRERMVGELLSLTPDQVGNPNDYGRMKVEGHQRISVPISIIGYTLVALVCLLTGDFSRKGQARRVGLAVVIVTLLQIGGLGLVSAVAKNLALLPLLHVYALLPVVVGATLLVVSPNWRWRRIPPPIPAHG